MEGSGNGGVTAVVSAAIYSPSPGFYPFTAWNIQLGLQLLSTDCLILCNRDGKEASANTGFYLKFRLNWAVLTKYCIFPWQLTVNFACVDVIPNNIFFFFFCHCWVTV